MSASVRYIVEDVDAAVSFYTERLGFTVEQRPGPGFAALRRGDLRLLLNRPGAGGAGRAGGDGTGPEPGGWARFQLELDSLDETVAELKASGARFRTDVVTGQGGRQALVEDPSGNAVELFEPNGADTRLRAIAAGGLVLLGCGKMGTAMLEGWLARGLPPAAVTALDPAPTPRLEALAREGLRLNADPPERPAVLVVAVKPQMMTEALPRVARLGGGPTLVLSIAAGTPIAAFERTFGPGTPVVRAMPNTPAAIGRGITALVGNAAAGETGLASAEALLAAVGETVRLGDEGQMDAVTAVSGSGPAYVFLLIETLAAAGEAEGLAPDLALSLARATVAGAGALALGGEDPATLRRNVTSPGGTTAAALAVLADPHRGMPALLREAVAAAAARSRELAG